MNSNSPNRQRQWRIRTSWTVRGCAVVFFLAGLCAGGCSSSITAVPADPDCIAEDYPVFSDQQLQGLNIDSVNFLAFFGLTERFSNDPAGVLRELYARGSLFGNDSIWQVIADLSYYQATRESDPTISAAYYLTAAQTAWRYLFTSGKEPLNGRMWTHYDNATLHLFKYLKDNKLVMGSGYEIEPICGPRVHFEAPENWMGQSLDRYEVMEACAYWQPENNQVFSMRRGLGVPLIMHAPLKLQEARPEDVIKPPLLEPSTALLRFAPDESGGNRQTARWEFVDSMRYEVVTDNGATAPLAMDITTPLAYALARPNPFRSIYFLFFPSEMGNLEGLYLTQPWQPDKIPVVLTHGLMSNPRTWAQLLNSLYLDSRLREHYQFWLFAYPTGNPVLYSAFQLRSALALAEKKFGHGNDNFYRMVVIGHSMGGLLTKAQITNTGTELETYALKGREAAWEAITPEEREYLKQLLCFERPAYIKRAVFLSTPHRGSSMAAWTITQWLSDSITLPGRLYDIAHQAVVRLNLAPDNPEVSFRTGLDNLEPDDRILIKLNELDFHTVPYHSLMGNEDEANALGGSDGVVPYSSSHLDGAVSELVVKSGHSVQDKSKAIAEVNRILIQHLIENGRLQPDGREFDRTPTALPEKPFQPLTPPPPTVPPETLKK